MVIFNLHSFHFESFMQRMSCPIVYFTAPPSIKHSTAPQQSSPLYMRSVQCQLFNVNLDYRFIIIIFFCLFHCSFSLKMYTNGNSGWRLKRERAEGMGNPEKGVTRTREIGFYRKGEVHGGHIMLVLLVVY